jgi:hypothetical protein
MKNIHYDLLLKWVLWLIAIHSICFGISLVILPIHFIEFFGFRLAEKFFADQGGVFHLVVAVVYIWAALDLENSFKLIVISCTAKFVATCFLLSYYFFADPIFMVFFSGIADFLMGLAILILYKQYRKSVVSQNLNVYEN